MTTNAANAGRSPMRITKNQRSAVPSTWAWRAHEVRTADLGGHHVAPAICEALDGQSVLEGSDDPGDQSDEEDVVTLQEARQRRLQRDERVHRIRKQPQQRQV